MSTVVEAVLERLDAAPRAVAVRHKRRGAWEPTTAARLAARARALAVGLRDRGVVAGEAVVLCGDADPGMVAVDLAAQLAGAWTLALPPTLLPDEILDAVEAQGARLAYCSDRALAAQLLDAAAQRSPALDALLVERAVEHPGDRLQVVELDALAAAGAAPAAVAVEADRAFAGYSGGRRGGAPRLVAWTHGDARRALATIAETGLVRRGDEVACHVPIAHPVARLLGVYAPLLAGGALTFAESSATFADDLVGRSPAVLVCTPWLPEALMARHELRLAATGGARGAIARRALRTLAAGRRGPARVAATWAAGRWVRRHLGLARTRWLACTLEPLAPEVVAFYAALGVEVRAPYGTADEGIAATAPPADAAAELESALRASPYVARAAAVDPSDPHGPVVIDPDPDALAAWAQLHDVPHSGLRSLLERPEALALLHDAAARAGVAGERLVVRSRPLSLDDGELTWLGTPRRQALAASASPSETSIPVPGGR